MRQTAKQDLPLKSHIPSINIKVHDIKSLMWKHFVDSAYSSGKVHF